MKPKNVKVTLKGISTGSSALTEVVPVRVVGGPKGIVTEITLKMKGNPAGPRVDKEKLAKNVKPKTPVTKK